MPPPPNKKAESDPAKPALPAGGGSGGGAKPGASPPRAATAPPLQPSASAMARMPAEVPAEAPEPPAGAKAAAAAAGSAADDEEWDEAQRIADLAVERHLLEPSQLRFLQKLHSDLQSAGSHKSLYQVIEASKIIENQTLIALRDEVRQSKPQRLGDYELLAQLGTGNTGQVYRAKHVVKGYEAALRVLSPALVSDKAFLDRFVKSAREAARLDHPHLVRTLEVGDAQGTYFLVSALVEGESLEQSVEDHGPLQPLEALQMAEHILLALTYLQQEGVQHLNIRPENIMLDNANKTARLSDTGHVKPPMRRDKVVGETADGTMHRPTYAAPEQIFSSLAGDERTDLYSLGACLYFAMTGQAPLTSLELARLSIERGPSLDPRKQDDSIPVAAAEFTQWLMAWSPDARPADPQEALKKLVHILAQLKTKLKKSSRVDVTASVDRIQRDAAGAGSGAGPGPGVSGGGGGSGGGNAGSERRRKSKRLSEHYTAARGRTTVLAEPDENPALGERREPVILPKYIFFAIAMMVGMALGALFAAVILLVRHNSHAPEADGSHRRCVRTAMAGAGEAEFREPGLLVDGDLCLVLMQFAPADPARERVPEYKFEMRRTGTTQRLGGLRLRVADSEAISRTCGQIGYDVDSPHRGKKYAARAVRLVLPLARALGLPAVWITCAPENVASRRSCEFAGAVYVDTVEVPADHRMYAEGFRTLARYRIGLES